MDTETKVLQETPVAGKPQSGVIPWKFTKKGVVVLLVTSRGTGRWVIPKGWVAKKMSRRKSAEKEAMEEAGVVGRLSGHRVGEYTYDKILDDGSVVASVVEVYSMEVKQKLSKWPEKGERRRKWMPASVAAACVDEPELKAIIEAFSAGLVESRKTK